MFKKLFKLFVLFTFMWPECYSMIKINEPKLIPGTPVTVPYSQFVVSIVDVDGYGRVNYCRGHRCGGIIIGPRTILTAALCIYDKKPELLYVIAGSTKLGNATHSRQAIRVQKKLIHPLYEDNVDKSKHDIGLLYLLHKLIEYPEKVAIYKDFSCPSSLSSPGTKCTHLGWGVKRTVGNRVIRECDVLTYKDLTIIENEDCEKKFKHVPDSSGYNTCAARSEESPTKEQSIADGDLGPLFCEGVLFGVSGTSESLNPFFPTYFTNVCDYKDWVKDSSDSIAYRTSSTGKLNDNYHFEMLGILVFIIYVYINATLVM